MPSIEKLAHLSVRAKDKMLVDDILTEIGIGKTQVIVFLSLALPIICSSWHIFATNFIGDVPEFICKRWSSVGEDYHMNSTNQDAYSNVSVSVLKNVSLNVYELLNTSAGIVQRLPVSKLEDQIDQCELTLNDTSFTCSAWTYVNDETQFVSQWDLVCDRNVLVHLSATMFMSGTMGGVLLCPILSDAFGRRPANLISSWLFLILGLTSTLSSNYTVYIVLRFCTGFFKAAMFYSGYTLTCEWFPPNRRSIPGCANMLFWAAGVMSLPGLMYLVPHWRVAMIAMTAPLAVTLFYPLFLPESLHWYYAQGHFDKAEQVLKKVAKWNNVTLSQGMLDDVRRRSKKIKEAAKASKRPNMLDVARMPTLRLYAGLLCVAWFTSALVYYGLTLSTSVLVGNKYWNCFLSGLVEIPAYVANVYLLERFGRRIPLCVYEILAGVPLFIIFFIPHTTGSGVDLTPVITILTLLGKLGITAAASGMHLITAEIYPTVVRNTGLGFSAFTARIAAMLSPFTVYFTEVAGGKIQLVFGVCGLVSAAIFLCLPETADMPLMETLDDFHALKKNKRNIPNQSSSPEVTDEIRAML